MVLVRVWEQYDKFDPVKGSFLHWVNRVISNAIINILRDNYMKFQRPCISGCIHNMGEDDCSQTPSGKQCEECPIYKEWKKRKISHYNVKQTLPLNTHLREAESKVDSSIDFNHYKTLIDKMMRKKMNHHEYSLYKKIFIEGRDEKEVGEEIGYVKSGHTYAGYQMIRKMKQKARDLAKQFLEDENLS